MPLIGFSTGAFHNFLTPVSREAIELCRSMNLDAIEISCINKQQISLLKNIKRDYLKPYFSYISLHAPSRKISYGVNPETISILERIWQAHLCLNFNSVIIHPDTVEDFAVFRDCPLPIAFENMDSRKDFGKTVDDFEAIFTKVASRLALDLNHCYTNDNSMDLAQQFSQKFKGKICEFHLSGFQQYHELLHKTRQAQIIAAISSADIPIIIESNCFNQTQAIRELRYILQFL